MTKQEAMEILQELWRYEHTDKYNDKAIRQALDIAMECIQDCIDKEESPCYGCDHSHCNNCLYSGRIPD